MSEFEHLPDLPSLPAEQLRELLHELGITPDTPTSQVKEILEAEMARMEARMAARQREIDFHRDLCNRVRPYVKNDSDTVGELIEREASVKRLLDE
jgi:hypothetical protein